jgi:hypothetical protein
VKRIALSLMPTMFLLAACGRGPQATAQPPMTSTPIALPPTWTSTPTPPDTTKRISAPSNEVIALWKTYRNEWYGYEIQHPTDWIVTIEYFWPDSSRVSFENESCVFIIEDISKGYSFDIELEKEGCFIEQVYFNDIYMTIIHCPKDPLEYRFPINGLYLHMAYDNRWNGKWTFYPIPTQPTPLADPDTCQEVTDQIFSTFYFFRLEGEENPTLLEVAQNFPQRFTVLEISYVDFEGDGTEEIVVIGHSKYDGNLEVHIFRLDLMTNDVRRIYFNEMNGQELIKLSTSDIDNDDKEDLLIQASDLSTDFWHLFSIKDDVILMNSPPLIYRIHFGLGIGYDLSGKEEIYVLPEGMIFERNYLSRIGDTYCCSGSLDIYYEFHDNVFSIVDYELAKPADIPQPTFTPTPKPTATPIIIGTPPADWKVFRSSNYGFRIMHPEKISLTKEEKAILLHHSIPHEHGDPCDFRGDAPQLQELTDFEVRIEVVPQSLRETIELMEMEDYVQEFIGEDELLFKPGYSTGKINVGSLRGYSIKQGIEECGRYVYFFPLSDGSTLFVIRSIITEFTSIIMYREEYLALPGIIPPEEEEALFLKILSTFEVIE